MLRELAGVAAVGRLGALCSGEKFLLKGRTVTAEGRFPERGSRGGPWRGGRCLRRP